MTGPVLIEAFAGGVARLCVWCEQPLPPGRRDALTCSQRCRQARHRFRVAVGVTSREARPLRLAYADPPYPGKAHLYRGHPDYAGEVDHAALLSRLQEYDGWALSTSAASLPSVLSYLEHGHGFRVAAWFRGSRAGLSSGPRSAWEPVVYKCARSEPSREYSDDALIRRARPRMTDPRRVIGAKPAAFCGWLFDLLGAAQRDSFDDLFPGSGGVARAWRDWSCSPAGDTSRRTPSDASPKAYRDASLGVLRDTSAPGGCDG